MPKIKPSERPPENLDAVVPDPADVLGGIDPDGIYRLGPNRIYLLLESCYMQACQTVPGHKIDEHVRQARNVGIERYEQGIIDVANEDRRRLRRGELVHLPTPGDVMRAIRDREAQGTLWGAVYAPEKPKRKRKRSREKAGEHAET